MRQRDEVEYTERIELDSDHSRTPEEALHSEYSLLGLRNAEL